MMDDEAALLEELKAISSRSASRRFQDENDRIEGASELTASVREPPAPATKASEVPSSNAPKPPKQKTSAASSRNYGDLPPWKRKAKAVANNDAVDVVVAAPPPKPNQDAVAVPEAISPQSDEISPEEVKFVKPNDRPFTFQGNRGGSAEDADLLAELMAISNKSASTNRFTSSEDNDLPGPGPGPSSIDDSNSQRSKVEPKTITSPTQPRTKKASDASAGTLPPWKRKAKAVANNDAVDVVVAAPPPKPNQDAVAVPEAISPQSDEISPEEVKFVKPNDRPFTFQGNRGGSAEDADLLAELMAISNKSASTNRFTSSEDNDLPGPGPGPSSIDDSNSQRSKVEPKTITSPTQPRTKKASDASAGTLPPWKRKAKAVANNDAVDVVVAAPPPKPNQDAVAVPEAISPQSDDISPEEVKFVKPNDRPFTFQGNRGGSAEDADLLAELMAISNKSASTNRFTSSEDNDLPGPGPGPGPSSIDDSNSQRSKVEPKTITSPTQPRTKKASDASAGTLPPWKRKVKAVANNDAVDVVVAAPPPKPNQDAVAVPEAISPQSDDISPEEVKFVKPNDRPFTFQGNRGGSAEDADLLAELMAISNKSASTNRFTSSEDNDLPGPGPGPGPSSIDDSNSQRSKVEPKTITSPTQPRTKKASDASAGTLPPWKRKAKAVANNYAVDVVVAAPPPKPNQDAVAVPEAISPQSDDISPEEVKFVKPNDRPFTFQGNRGGSAEDADLLAELMAISNKSASTNRFTSSEDNDLPGPGPGPSSIDDSNSQRSKVEPKTITSPTQPRTKKASDASAGTLPPWKRKAKAVANNDAVDVVVAAPPPKPNQDAVAVPEAISPQSDDISPEEVKFVKPNDRPFTFQGNRGGSAEDADLLAELMAISNKSASTNRFTSSEDNDLPGPGPGPSSIDDSNSQRSKVEPKTITSPTQPRTKKASDASAGTLPPWKRKAKAVANNDAVDVVVAAPPPKPNQDAVAVPEAISPQSDEISPEEVKFVKPNDRPFTFQGNRGGSAEDADLLAELMAISNKSASTNRFTSSEDNDLPGPGPGPGPSSIDDSNSQRSKVEPKTITSPTQPRTKKASDASAGTLPPWKRKAKAVANNDAVDVVVAAPPPKPNQDAVAVPEAISPQSDEISPEEVKFVKPNDRPFTFQGNRGGSAEDADLLAELMAISNKSASTNRFTSSEDNDLPGPGPGPSSIDDSNSQRSKIVPRNMHSHSEGLISTVRSPEVKLKGEPPGPQAMVGPRAAAVVSVTDEPLGSNQSAVSSGGPVTSVDDIAITRDSLEVAVKDKNWKVRKQAYIFMKDILEEEAARNQAVGSVRGETIMRCIDQTILSMVADSNANALDCALQFGISFAHHCVDASDPTVSSRIVSSLLKGNGFSSSRGSTVKLASSLASKLMEVGANGAESVHAVVGVLLEKGITSKKPKIVLASISAIYDAALDFGASTLPLAAVKMSAPKMLQHSNASARETGMKIISEICRALGSKAPLQDLIESLKPAQLSQLDSMLEMQPKGLAPRVGLRSSAASGAAVVSSHDALAALEAQSKEMEAKRFASRPPVDIFLKLPRTDYSTRLILPKWSEKVAALDILLECGGEKPYKLEQPSSSINYAPLIGEMKKLLGHTHFAVASKATEVLVMLAEGVGERLYPNLRPFVLILLQLGKDKKLTKSTASCLDSFFGNILSLDHLLEGEDAIPLLLNERLEKNALVRTTSIEYLVRCVLRRDSAGKRGGLTAPSIKALGSLARDKLSDTDAKVRKSALNLLQTLLSLEDEPLKKIVNSIVEELKTSNARAYKALRPPTERVSASPVPSSKESVIILEEKIIASSPQRTQPEAQTKPMQVAKLQSVVTDVTGKSAGASQEYEESLTYLNSLDVPNWSASEDDGGILSGLQSAKWLCRHRAIQAVISFCTSYDTFPDGTFSKAVLSVIMAHTKSFRDSNINIMKSTFELIVLLCEIHTKSETPFPSFACKNAARTATEKLADKKLSTAASTVLTELCVVNKPSLVLSETFAALSQVKSPVVHEAYLQWLEKLFLDFGVQGLLMDVQATTAFLAKECDSTNLKVKKAALSVFGELHRQLGPVFRSLSLSVFSESSLKSQLEATFETNSYDSGQKDHERKKKCILVDNSVSSKNGNSSSGALELELPRLDLMEQVGQECAQKMQSKEGKNAWKLRKEAMDEVDTALKSCNGMLQTSGGALKSLTDLLRVLKERLSDSQSNLKPVAARVIGIVLGSVDGESQGKLGKIVFPSLVGAAMNDGRKPMRDASLEAIKTGTKAHELDGGKPNESSLEALIVALVGELKESEFKTAGIPDVLLFTSSVAEYMPNLDSIITARAQPLGEKLAHVMVDCLTSSKAETRAAGESLVKTCFDLGKISSETLRKGLKHLKPAQYRSVSPVIEKIIGASQNLPPSEKENLRSKLSGSPGPKPTKANTDVRAGLPPPRRQSSIRLTKTSKVSRPVDQNEDAQLSEKAPKLSQHPLSCNGTAQKARRALGKSLNWVDFPEEPTGSMLLNSLNKTWSLLIPKSAQSVLFPSRGIKKQDDAKEGCDLISSAIDFESKHGGDHIIDQIDYILKWSTFALCSRENTVGLQSLLSMLTRLVEFLGERCYVMGENEGGSLFPYLLEKTSVAKGRFRDSFNDLIRLAKEANVLTTKIWGANICAITMERSKNAQARVLAYMESAQAVDLIGLSGIGKRGLLVATKMVTEESLPENRSAALDLITVVLGKMDGDIDRLVRLCGSSCTDKSRELIEERWQKRGLPKSAVAPALPSVNPDDNGTEIRRSRLPASRKSIADRRRTLQGLTDRNDPSRVPGDETDTAHSEPLPFQLRLGNNNGSNSSTRQTEVIPSLGPFTFSYHSMSSAAVESSEQLEEDYVPILAPPQHVILEPSNVSNNGVASTTGAAASLRARLLKIRQKHVNQEPVSLHPIDLSLDQKSTREPAIKESLQRDLPLVPANIARQDTDNYNETMNRFESLYSSSLSALCENDENVISCITGLKRFHSAISEQEVSTGSLGILKQEISQNVTKTVEHLTSLLKFAFDRGDPSRNAGMCVPLLSVVLATLMSLFRESQLAKQVSQEALLVLIRETGRCLLDARLAVSATHVSGLDESTSSQMVRGMNKLAVQAATGSSRHNALQALLILEQQLTLQEVSSPVESSFNGRLSRIVVKLFGKVIKTEETKSIPYSTDAVDLEALLCTIEDMLVGVAGNEVHGRLDEKDKACRDMATSLMVSILKFKSPNEVKDLIQDLGIDGTGGGLWSILASLGISCNNISPDEASVASPTKSTNKSKDVAELVSAIGSAPDGPERWAAIDVLRGYRAKHGDSDLNSHLENVSDVFKAYIWEQLSVSISSPARTRKDDADSTLPMSARIRNLRSKLSASDLRIEESETLSPVEHSTLNNPVSPNKHSASTVSKIPTPSRIPRVSTPVDNPKSVLSLRERLAAAQSNRSRVSETEESNETSSSAQPGPSNGSHAAMLRARLQAVRMAVQTPDN